MSKEKQIDEIAKLICTYPQCIHYNIIGECANAECQTVDIAEHLYNAGYRKQEWISVEDRLPNEKEMVLVFCHRVYDDGGYYDSILVAELTKEGKFVPFNCSPVKKGIVTHWMPLPEAPKMKGGE